MTNAPTLVPAETANDVLLAAVLAAAPGEERRQAIGALLQEEAYGRIEKILARRFRQSRLPPDHADDIRHEVVVRLMNRLNALTAEGDAIASFRDYVAAVTFNAFSDFAGRAYPLRTRLRNRVKSVLTTHADFAVWEWASGSVCGLARWSGQPPVPSVDAAPFEDIAEALHRMFRQSGGPLAVEDVVTALAAAAGIPSEEQPMPLTESAAVTTSDPARGLEDRQYLARLWAEIRELPLRQRVALLMHARDTSGESVTRLLPLAGIASITAIAAALEMRPEALAALWPRLPLDDLSIALTLDLTRQQIINLRQSARNRLTRKMGRRGR
jgi:hypothetical protein